MNIEHIIIYVIIAYVIYKILNFFHNKIKFKKLSREAKKDGFSNY